MTNPQLFAARPILNKVKATVKLDTQISGDAEALTPYLIANPSVRGETVVVTGDSLPADIAKALARSISGIV